MAWTYRLITIAVLITLMGCFTGALGNYIMHFCWKLALMMMVLVCVAAQEANYRRPTRVGVSCCKEVSRGRIPPEITLVGYKRQHALSPCVDAIIFYTETEKFCSDPKARWIQNRIRDLKKIED